MLSEQTPPSPLPPTVHLAFHVAATVDHWAQAKRGAGEATDSSSSSSSSSSRAKNAKTTASSRKGRGRKKAAAVDDDDDDEEEEEEDATSAKASSAEEKAFEAQVKLIWKHKDNLSALSTAALQEMLDANDRPTRGGRQKLIVRTWCCVCVCECVCVCVRGWEKGSTEIKCQWVHSVAAHPHHCCHHQQERAVDGLLFGRLLECDRCGECAWKYTAAGYECRGNISEWQPCTAFTRDPPRAKW